MIKAIVGVVTWNSRRKIDLLLETFFRHHAAGDYRVVLVDNGSEDDTVRLVRERYPRVEVIENGENLGVARARNKALRLRGEEHAVLLDDDLEFRDNALDRLIDRFEAFPDAGVVSPRLLYPDGTLQLSCRTFQTVPVLALRGTPLGRLFPDSAAVRRHLMADADHGKEQFVDWTLGACHAIRGACLDRTGLLDEGFFYLYEDVDFCFRVREAGFKVLYTPCTEVVHHYRRKSARSFNRMTLKHSRSIIRYLRKHRNFF